MEIWLSIGINTCNYCSYLHFGIFCFNNHVHLQSGCQKEFILAIIAVIYISEFIGCFKIMCIFNLVAKKNSYWQSLQLFTFQNLMDDLNHVQLQSNFEGNKYWQLLQVIAFRNLLDVLKSCAC